MPILTFLAILLAQVIFLVIIIWILARLLAAIWSHSRTTIFLAWSIVGLSSGLLTAWLWPHLDSIIYPNMAGFLVGEVIYHLATSRVEPGTDSPHLAVSWFLRIPQLYVFTSTLLFAAAGATIQLIYNRRQSVDSP